MTDSTLHIGDLDDLNKSQSTESTVCYFLEDNDCASETCISESGSSIIDGPCVIDELYDDNWSSSEVNYMFSDAESVNEVSHGQTMASEKWLFEASKFFLVFFCTSILSLVLCELISL